MRATVAGVLYFLGSFGASFLWDRVLHFQHTEFAPSTLILWSFTGVLSPFVLGFASAAVLNARGLRSYLPLVVAAVAVVVLRPIIDDLPGEWMARNVLQICAIAALTAAFAVAGASFGTFACWRARIEEAEPRL